MSPSKGSSAAPAAIILAPRCPRMRDNLAVRQIDDATLVYDPADDQCYLLDRSSAAVLRLCDGTRDIGQLVAQFESMFKVPTSVARQTCAAALRGLLANRILCPAPTYAASVHLRTQPPWVNPKLAIAEDTVLALHAGWSVRERYAAASGDVLVQANVAGLVNGVLGVPTQTCQRAEVDDQTATATEGSTIHVHRDAGIGTWSIARNAQVRSRTVLAFEYETHLRAELRALLLERQTRAILLPGLLLDGGKTLVLHLEVPPESGDADGAVAVVPLDEVRYLLVTADAHARGSELHDRLGTAVASTSRLEVETIVLRDLFAANESLGRVAPGSGSAGGNSPGSDSAGSGSAARVQFSADECLPCIVSATVSWGLDPVAGFAILERLVGRSKRFFVEADSEARCRSLVAGLLGTGGDNSGQDTAQLDLPGDCVLHLADGVVFHQAGNHTVALGPGTESPVLLDPQARALLGLADGVATIDEIAQVTQEVFRTDRSEVDRQLRQLFRASQSVGLVHILPRGEVPQGKQVCNE